ncbi:MAG: hypothetical protein JWN40_2358 [Phycisphaerales bacterium]|nr:hypothetical protein [Phycisphaerales bacterium]
MRDSLDDLEMDLGPLPEIRNTDNPHSQNAAQQVRRALRGKHVCPFCGTQRETDVGACMHCSLEDTPTTRSATRGKLGPWYVLQSRNPSAPGMNFATLMVLVQKGRVTARSVLRGPTTGQFWRHAAKVKGVSREFGLCWNCGSDVAKTARACAGCKRLQEPPLNPDVLLESAEFSSEELAEAMWSDETTSSQMSASATAHVPLSRPSPVDRLASRGGVRREVPPQYPPPASPAQSAPSRTASAQARAPREMTSLHDIESLPTHGLEMAVFQRTPARGGGGRIAGKIFKSIFVAVLLSSAGVVAMCSFDDGFRKKVVDIGQRGWAWANTIRGTTPQVPQPRAEAETVRLPADQAKARAWELWKNGVEAEQRGDFSVAVKSWEKIKTLSVPEEDLPLGLDGRITAAKKRVK